MAHNNAYDVDSPLLRRVYAEYLEMPGLQLTVPQASRLWSLKPEMSAQVLDGLVEASLLRRVGDRYVLADSGRLCA